VRYVAHRDRTSPAGRVFGRDGGLTDADRRRLVEYVAGSTKGLQPRWLRNSEGALEDHQRAVYQMILSPEDWRGLDLRHLARLAMQQLDADAGPGGLGPWFAAEHRNTKHHHVHIVLAARRELEPGKFSTVLITRKRLQRMKAAIAMEIERERTPERQRADKTPAPTIYAPTVVRDPHHHAAPNWRWMHSAQAKARSRSHSSGQLQSHRPIAATLLHLRGVAIRYHHQMERELEEELARRERGGWVR
jgi:hypothetical protein